MPRIVIVERLGLSDAVGELPTINESVALVDQFKLILPKIPLPDYVVYALKNSKAMYYWDMMQSMSIEVQKIRRVKTGDYVLHEDINQPKTAVDAVIHYVEEGLRWEPGSVAEDVEADKDAAAREHARVPVAETGDIYDVEWHNGLVRAIWKLVDAVRRWWPLRLGPEVKSLLREKRPDDFIEPDDHNNKRDVLENVVNTAMMLGGYIVVLLERSEEGGEGDGG